MIVLAPRAPHRVSLMIFTLFAYTMTILRPLRRKLGGVSRMRSAAGATAVADAPMEDMSADRKPSGVEKENDLLEFIKAMASGMKTPYSTHKSVDFATNEHTINLGASLLSETAVNSNHFNYSTPQQVPGSIFTTAHKAKLEKTYDFNKKYKLCIASNNQNTLDRQSFCTIRGGFAFCINQDCTLSHVGSKLPIAPSQAYIRRSPKQAFIEPTVSTSRFDFHLLDSWMNITKTLAEWTDLFQLAESAMYHIEDGEITEQDLLNQKDTRSKALTFKP